MHYSGELTFMSRPTLLDLWEILAYGPLGPLPSSTRASVSRGWGFYTDITEEGVDEFNCLTIML